MTLVVRSMVPAASIVLVTVPVSPVPIRVPLVVGRDSVVVPAVAVAWRVAVPLVEPGKATLLMLVRAWFAEARLRVRAVVPR